MMRSLRCCLLLVLACGCCFAWAGDYDQRADVASFIASMVKEHKFEEADLRRVLSQAEKKQSILDAISRPAEKTKPWHEYRNIFVTDSRAKNGALFWQENAQVLAKVSSEFGVEEEIIVSIIGVETLYGRYMGSYRVVDALATLGFDYPPRAKFFRGQLEHFFLLSREQQQDPLALTGSYAGAMGFGQFIPSSYRQFARDYDGDGFADIWNNKSDAIKSVANYFKAHGWQSGQDVMHPLTYKPVTSSKSSAEALINSSKRPYVTVKELSAMGFSTGQVKLDANTKAVPLRYQGAEKEEYWVGFNNFYVITRYNRSRLYARSVWELSEEIKKQYMALQDNT